jgi:restriction system protein
MIQSVKEAIQGWAPDWMDITVGTDEGGFRAGVGLVGETLLGGEPDDLPEIMLRAALSFSGAVDDGDLVDAVALPWFEILDVLARDPAAAYQIAPRKWEEIIAGAYARAGFDEVVLTPHSGDHGRDVIATKRGVGSIRIFDQVKAYKPGHVVTAEEVRALLGTMMAANVSKGIVSTTSTFAPRIGQDPGLSPYIPYRIELRPGDVLLPWLESLRTGRCAERSSS